MPLAESESPLAPLREPIIILQVCSANLLSLVANELPLAPLREHTLRFLASL